MARPGIMLYFDILEPIRVLPDSDKGRLLVAMLEYGKDGTIPDFDGMLSLAWGFVRPKIDKDYEEYNRSVLRRQYATTCRERKRKGEPEIGFDEWLKTIDDKDDHMISHDISRHQNASMMINDDQWYPTTTTATSTSTTTTTAAAANTTEPEDITAAAASRKVEIVGGKLGKGVVFLSDEQIEALLDTLGIEVFDYYVDKLSSFIIKNDAKVQNHYETILKWWKEDSEVRKPVPTISNH